MPENFEKQSDTVELHAVKQDVFNSHLLDQAVKFRFEL